MIEYILIASLFSYGWVTAFSSGHIFENIGNLAENNLPEKIYKPIIGCVICNAFWIGTIMYWIFWGDYWVHWLVVAISASGLNAIFSNIINKLEDISGAIFYQKEKE